MVVEVLGEIMWRLAPKGTRDKAVQFFSGARFFFIEECLDSTAGAI